MLFEYLEHVREQPKEARRRFAFIWSIVITGIIVLIWLSIVFGRSYALKGGEESVPEETMQTLETENVRDSFDSSNNFFSNDFDTSPGESTGTSGEGDTSASSSAPSDSGTTTGDSIPAQGADNTDIPQETQLETPPLWP